jgi:hypothetical protein
MISSNSEPKPVKPQKKNWLNLGLIVLAVLVYLLFLTGDYFMPVKSPLWLAAALLLLAGGIGLKLFQTRRISSGGITTWLQANWPALGLALALLGGGLLRYQTLAPRPDTPTSPAQAFATQARTIINTSDWQPKSYEQPPLYLFVGAGLVELNFFQQASAGKIATPEEVTNQTVLAYTGYLNLILGLVTLLIVYGAAARWWQSRPAGAIAAGLAGLSGLAYQATPEPRPQLLAAALAAGSFYALTYAAGKPGWPPLWAGLLAGLAAGAAYGAFLVMIPLLGITLSHSEKGRRRKATGLLLGGWVVGWTLACPGWLLSLNHFVQGLTAIKPAPAGALNSYFQQFFSYDLGLLAVLFITLAAFSLRRSSWAKLWPVVAFPLLYFSVLGLSGPLNLARLALVMPWLAIAGAGPLTWPLGWVEAKLPVRLRQTGWAGAGLTLAILAAVLVISILGRRFFG